MQPILTLDETDYTTNLAGALNEYVKRHSDGNFPAPSTPHTRRQSYKNLNETRCFDIIQRISDASLLILEVKVTNDSKTLHGFDKQQREIDSALREVGIPIEYCYNKKEDYLEVNTPEYTLTETMASAPSDVADDSGKIHKQDTHIKVIDLVDKLIHSSESNSGMIGALFSKGILKRMRQVNIKVLFFAKHANGVELFDTEDLYDLYASYERLVSLGQGINVETATRLELASEFKKNAIDLKAIIEKWKQKQLEKQKTNTISTGFGR